MNQKDTLAPYIKSHLQNGVPADTIKQQLVAQGWEPNVVDEVIRDVSAPSQPVAGVPQPGVVEQPAATQPQPSAANSYHVRQAFKDAYHAILNNVFAIGVIGLIGLIIAAAVITIAVVVSITAIFGSTILFGAVAMKDMSILQVALRVLPWVALVMIAVAVVSAFVQTLLGLVINDGADGKKSNVTSTIVAGAKRSPHVMLATLLYVLIVMAPLLVTLLIGLLIMSLVPGLSWIVFLLAIVAIVATVILAIRLTLMPIIAIFEPATPLTQLYSRTQSLMAEGGVLFVVKLMVVMLVINIIISVIFPTHSGQGGGFNPISVLGIIPQVIVSLFYSAVWVMFYRNRKALKG